MTEHNINNLINQTASELGEDPADVKNVYDDINTSMQAFFSANQANSDEDDDIDGSQAQRATRSRSIVHQVLKECVPLIALATMRLVKHRDIDLTELKREVKLEVINEVKSEIKTELKTELLNEIKSEVITEVKSSMITEVNTQVASAIHTDVKLATTQIVDTNVSRISKILTRKHIKCTTDLDKREAADRKLNIILTGITENPGERRNPDLIGDIVLKELNDIGCNISRYDISDCFRIFRRTPSPDNPGMIILRLVALQTKHYILSKREFFTDHTRKRFMNEDMTPLQRQLFNYLRTKEEIVHKKSVGYKDGKIVFVLVAHTGDERVKWSKVENVLDLAGVDIGLEVDLHDSTILQTLGLKECQVNMASE